MRVHAMIVLAAALLLHWPHPAAAAGPPLVILMPGGSGIAKPDGFLIRNRQAFQRAGFQTFVSGSPRQTVQAARKAREGGRKVFLVGISIGVARSAAALAAGAPADAAVFYSGAYQMARTQLGSPDRLPPTLLIHHRADGCPTTAPGNVDRFRQWSRGRVVRVQWITNTGNGRAWICGPRGAHGFFMDDRQPLAAGIAFLKAH